MGNLTYALSICVSSMEMDHLIANASWLAGKSPVSGISDKAEQGAGKEGSVLTIFLDMMVSEKRESVSGYF